MSSQQQPPIQYFIFTYDEVQYAIPVVSIAEIIEVSEWLPMPHDFPGCFGNISYRDLLLPVFNPTVLGTNIVAAEASNPNIVIVVVHEGVGFCLAMKQRIGITPPNALDEVNVLDEADVTAIAEGVSSSSSSKPFFKGTFAYNGNVLVLLDIVAIANAVKLLCNDQRFIPQQDVHLSMEQEEHQQHQNEQSDTDVLQHRFMCARIGEITLAIPIEHVMEVTEDYEVTPAFKVTPRLRGFINLRGQVIACFDISLELGLPLRKLHERNQCIVVQAGESELALCVDKILGLHAFPQDNIQSADTALSGEITRYAQGILEVEQDTILILSVPDILDSPHLQPYLRQEG